jgi:hypothetical protein
LILEIVSSEPLVEIHLLIFICQNSNSWV